MPKLSPDTPLLLDFPSEINPWSESSPSYSLGSSTETETESDEDDDYIAGLAEQIAHSMLDEEDISEPADAADKINGVKTSSIPVFPCGLNQSSQKVAVSPQSSWSTNSCCWKQPTDSVLPLPIPDSVLPPPVCNTTVPAASISKDRYPSGGPHGNRTSCRSRDEDRKLSNNTQCHQPQHRLPRNEGAGWINRQSRSGHGSGHASKGVQQKTARHNHNFGGHPRTGGKSMEWSGGQQWAGGHGVNGGSGMRAVFLGSPGSGRESTGTGVFLPRCIGGTSDYRRKPACSTVLLPSRIVQVLNLNVEDMRSHPAPMPVGAMQRRSEFARGYPPQMYIMELNSGASKPDIGAPPAFPRKSQSARARHSSEVSAEFSLPTEWTY
ncbi:hypothetical protein R1flu_011808 [Riccia fluitans]|uniref:Uncharacterized protein n=1 Tax=Riccia fluitans TaxID=41844 RepID=A0ABD1Z968_9MARC